MLLMYRAARAWTEVWVVFESLLVVSPSIVPVELTEALLSRTVPSATAAPTLTWIVKTVVPATARMTERVQVTYWSAAVHAVHAFPTRRSSDLGRVSEALRLPVWLEGPLLVTVRV